MTNFHEFRQHGIGGSDMAAIIGISAWQTPLDVYQRIVNPEEYEPQPDNFSMKMGRKREHLVLDEYEELNKTKLKRSLQITHPHYEFIRGNLDGQRTDKKVVVEAKNVLWTNQWGKGGSADIPPYILCQVAHYAYITDADHVDIPVVFDGNQYVVYRYERNEKLEKLSMQRAIRFWESHIIPKRPPPPSTSKDIENYIKVKPESSIQIDSKMQKEYNELKEIKKYEKRIKELKENIKLYMHDNEVLVDDNQNVLASYKENKIKVIDRNALKKAELYDSFVVENTCRRLLIK